MREHQEHREDCEHGRRETADYNRCPACSLPSPTPP